MFTDQKFDIVTLAMFPKFIYRFNTIPIKISATIFSETDKTILKVFWK